MKRVLWIVLDLVVFLVVFLAGSLLPELHILPMWSVAVGTGEIFVLDGLVLMLAVYVLLLLIAAVRKRLAIGWPVPTIAFGLALILGFLAKFGFKSV
jgi:hypothetical protein